MQTQSVFLENVIDESLDMQALPPAVFDAYLASGWRLLGYSIIRHNFSACRGKICRTIPLRIRLEGFAFSKSQRRLLRRNADLKVLASAIDLNAEKELLFKLHTERFRERRPESLHSFLSQNAGTRPVEGREISVYEGERLLACSYFHIGEQVVSGTYCFFDPEFNRRSLGAYTMLLELEMAQQLGKQYYYHGYCYDVPSQFDYKLNFENVEALDWNTGLWQSLARVPVRRWENEID